MRLNGRPVRHGLVPCHMAPWYMLCVTWPGRPKCAFSTRNGNFKSMFGVWGVGWFLVGDLPPGQQVQPTPYCP